MKEATGTKPSPSQRPRIRHIAAFCRVGRRVARLSAAPPSCVEKAKTGGAQDTETTAQGAGTGDEWRRRPPT
jgi:hypothetical protein